MRVLRNLRLWAMHDSEECSWITAKIIFCLVEGEGEWVCSHAHVLYLLLFVESQQTWTKAAQFSYLFASTLLDFNVVFNI